MAGIPRARFLLFLVLWGSLAIQARGDGLSTWFLSDPRARAYEGAQADLEELFDTASVENVPVAPLVDKLREGASKGVDSERLLGALRETIDRLLRARSILEQAAGSAAAGEDNVLAVSLLLQRGLPEELARELMDYGLRAGRGLPVTRAACEAVTSLLALGALGDAEALRVGELLLASNLPVSAYRSLSSVYLRAKASNLDDQEIVGDVIIGTLESGGGIISMDQKIARGNAARASSGSSEGTTPAANSQAGGSSGGDHPGGGPPATPPGQAKDKSNHKKDD